ncbi:hypothetical protein QHH03_30745, partial [Aphanizomenon sp. 202]|nr:hypothetical protein [Aphanizomenon sp. 202]
LGFWVLDLLGWKEIPVLLEFTRLSFLIVDKDFVCVVRIDNEGVQMRKYIVLTTDFFLDQMVLTLIVENYMNLLGAWATDIRTKHNEVWRLSVHVFLV